MLICDNHVHSSHSFDAQNSVEELCYAGIEKGIYAITITDHCEADGIKDGDSCEYGDFTKRIPLSLRDARLCREKFRNKIQVFTGVEIGQGIYAPQDIAKAVNLNEIDFVLGSIHNLKNEQDFFYLKYTEENISEYLSRYFDTLYELAVWNRFDSLAHLTYPLRYIYEQTDYKFNFEEYRESIDKIFKILIKNERALEINTSGLRKPMSQTLPAEREIHRYRQLGGKYITLGSDAHNTADLGAGIAEAALLARECGFKKYYIYAKHCPIAVNI